MYSRKYFCNTWLQCMLSYFTKQCNQQGTLYTLLSGYLVVFRTFWWRLIESLKIVDRPKHDRFSESVLLLNVFKVYFVGFIVCLFKCIVKWLKYNSLTWDQHVSICLRFLYKSVIKLLKSAHYIDFTFLIRIRIIIYWRCKISFTIFKINLLDTICKLLNFSSKHSLYYSFIFFRVCNTLNKHTHTHTHTTVLHSCTYIPLCVFVAVL
jgi:hypothetical protein